MTSATDTTSAPEASQTRASRLAMLILSAKKGDARVLRQLGGGDVGGEVVSPLSDEGFVGLSHVLVRPGGVGPHEDALRMRGVLDGPSLPQDSGFEAIPKECEEVRASTAPIRSAVCSGTVDLSMTTMP